MQDSIVTDRLTRVGVFYDGNYFLHISNYYNYTHPRRARLSIRGLHEFIQEQVAIEEGVGIGHSRIVDARYFRARISAQEASQKGNLLYYDRVFDDILTSEGILTHYLPIRSFHGRIESKGVETHMSLEAYELAITKKLDVVVIIASDGDFVPLVRKLNTLGVRVMLLCWELEFVNDEGQRIITRTSQDLYSEVTYPIPMHTVIDGGFRREVDVPSLFVVPNPNRVHPGAAVNPAAERPAPAISRELSGGDIMTGEIQSIKNGYGFIKYPPNNLFFHYSSVIGAEFSSLSEGDMVEYVLGENADGQPIAREVRPVSVAAGH